MLGELKRNYWKVREDIPHLLKGLKEDPPLRRLSRFVQTRCRRTIKMGGIVIRLSPQMGSAAVAYMLEGRYERPERRIIEYALAADDRVLELGTGIGYLSALCARKIGSDRVVTFEANPLLQPLIEETYFLNEVSPQVEFSMLGEHDGETSFYVSTEFWRSSTVSRRGKERRITAPVKAFNDILVKHKPTFLIIDIEGGEVDLIRFMHLDGVTKVCIELHPWIIGRDSEQEVRDFFLSQGFREHYAVSDKEHILYLRDRTPN